MKSALTILIIVASVVASTLEQPAQDPKLGANTVHGCYSSVGELQLNGKLVFNTMAQCAATCSGLGASVAASQEDSCYCGNSYPPANTLVDDSQCNEACPGYSLQACGGTAAFTVYNTGIELNVANSPGDGSSSKESSAGTSAAASTVSSSSALVSTTSSATTISTGSTSIGPSSTHSSTATFAPASSSSSSSPTAVHTSGAVLRLAHGGFQMAISALGAMLLV